MLSQDGKAAAACAAEVTALVTMGGIAVPTEPAVVTALVYAVVAEPTAEVALAAAAFAVAASSELLMGTTTLTPLDMAEAVVVVGAAIAPLSIAVCTELEIEATSGAKVLGFKNEAITACAAVAGKPELVMTEAIVCVIVVTIIFTI